MKNIDEFTEELSDAYSTGRYGGWKPCIKMLRSRKYNDKEIDVIIRSKWTRWAADMSNNPDRGTAKDLLRFLESFGKDEKSEVAKLVDEV